MNENLTPTPVNDLPPILPPQLSSTATRPGPTDPGTSTRPLDSMYARLRRLPARDTDNAVFGGVCATVAERLGVAPIAVRAAAVVSAFFGGLGVGLYLLAWAVLPDAKGSTHVEAGLRLGRGRSLIVLSVGLIAALGLLTGGLSFLASALPVLVTLAVLVGGGVWAWNRLTDRGDKDKQTSTTTAG